VRRALWEPQRDVESWRLTPHNLIDGNRALSGETSLEHSVHRDLATKFGFVLDIQDLCRTDSYEVISTSKQREFNTVNRRSLG
jgi:hypothetical protein